MRASFKGQIMFAKGVPEAFAPLQAKSVGVTLFQIDVAISKRPGDIV